MSCYQHETLYKVYIKNCKYALLMVNESCALDNIRLIIII
ncbi:hypothetical protein CLOBY_40920 [Clostridium saccharobutylicum]|nr:hypothetical protein CLOSC_41570 [Clostridium saccharobutylicum]OAV39994.1 hypothetical protein M945_2597 [Clostridium saccharobutylicum DSM 13864]AQS02330.1 hypothetical protein CSACC_41630 [Clostridium saccharobutylicum]AQS11934.1 hypothetical protein CLOBY_40920 [Clostridium saccharobutylicum]AQS16313.1 hypothetical protein CLOSACC_41630 [Clostridium saccharobutylicum]